jgi:hypothetical protein
MSAVVLKSKSGIGGATTQTGVPMQWSQSWFQHFVNNQLRGADVRNAVGAGGIVVSGNITTPYATITLGPTIPASLTFTGNETFAPASGNPTTVDTPATGANSAVIEYLQGMSNGGAYIQFNDDHTGPPVAEGYVGYGAALFTGAASTDFGIAAQAGNLRFSTNGGASTQMELSTAGALTISGSFAIHGNAAPTQVTGFGTPTGNAVIANFPGATASATQTSETVAEILVILKQYGLIGA